MYSLASRGKHLLLQFLPPHHPCSLPTFTRTFNIVKDNVNHSLVIDTCLKSWPIPCPGSKKTTDQRFLLSLQHFPQLPINHDSVNGNYFNPSAWANTKRNRWPYLQQCWVLEAQAVWASSSTAFEWLAGLQTGACESTGCPTRQEHES